jgi:hypothetical protein
MELVTATWKVATDSKYYCQQDFNLLSLCGIQMQRRCKQYAHWNSVSPQGDIPNKEMERWKKKCLKQRSKNKRTKKL